MEVHTLTAVTAHQDVTLIMWLTLQASARTPGAGGGRLSALPPLLLLLSPETPILTHLASVPRTPLLSQTLLTSSSMYVKPPSECPRHTHVETHTHRHAWHDLARHPLRPYLRVQPTRRFAPSFFKIRHSSRTRPEALLEQMLHINPQTHSYTNTCA